MIKLIAQDVFWFLVLCLFLASGGGALGVAIPGAQIAVWNLPWWMWLCLLPMTPMLKDMIKSWGI